MNSVPTVLLAQCFSCRGGQGVHPLVLLALVAGLWVVVRWIKNTWRKDGVSVMSKLGKIVIVVALIVVVGVVFIVKQKDKATVSEPAVANSQSALVTETPASNPPVQPQPVPAALPKLVDLGADKCIPCKMMAPILEELKTQYQGRLQVVFVDIWKNPDEAKTYKINLIPTQIFYDAAGKELFRHEGFFSKEDILAKWKALGIDLEKGTQNEK